MEVEESLAGPQYLAADYFSPLANLSQISNIMYLTVI